MPWRSIWMRRPGSIELVIQAAMGGSKLVMSSSRLRVITFDLDDTLWDNKPVMQRAEHALLLWLRQHYPEVAHVWSRQALQAFRQRILTAEPDIAHDLAQVRQRAMVDFAAAVGLGTDWVAPALAHFYQHRHRVTPFPGVPAMLRRLRKRWLIGAVTNGNADVSQIGLDDAFDFVIYAAAAGVAKPDIGIFETALARAGVPPQAAVHVGDDPVRDIGGALATGMQAVWINPAAQPWPGGPVPQAIFSDVLALEGWLAQAG